MAGRILLVGYEDSLLVTRATILSGRWPVKTAYPKDVLRVLREDPFDVVVLCHTLTAKETTVLLKGIRSQFPSVRVLALEFEAGSAGHLGACATAVSTNGPEEMFAAISYLLKIRNPRVA